MNILTFKIAGKKDIVIAGKPKVILFTTDPVHPEIWIDAKDYVRNADSVLVHQHLKGETFKAKKDGPMIKDPADDTKMIPAYRAGDTVIRLKDSLDVKGVTGGSDPVADAMAILSAFPDARIALR